MQYHYFKLSPARIIFRNPEKLGESTTISLTPSEKEREEKLERGEWDALLHETPDGQIEIKVSSEIMQLFEQDYNDRHDIEDTYILLANKKTGIIDRAVNVYAQSGPSSAGFPEGFWAYADKFARAKGYFVVGWYHLHPPFTKEEQSGKAGDTPSGEDTSNQDDLTNLQFIFLGHANPDYKGDPQIGERVRNFRTRVFLDQIAIEDHPLSKLSRKEKRKRKLVPINSYSGKEAGHLEIQIKPVNTKKKPLVGKEFIPPYIETIPLTVDTDVAIDLYFRCFFGPEFQSKDLQQKALSQLNESAGGNFIKMIRNLQFEFWKNGIIRIGYPILNKFAVIDENGVRGTYWTTEFAAKNIVDSVVKSKKIPEDIKKRITANPYYKAINYDKQP